MSQTQEQQQKQKQQLIDQIIEQIKLVNELADDKHFKYRNIVNPLDRADLKNQTEIIKMKIKDLKEKNSEMQEEIKKQDISQIFSRDERNGIMIEKIVERNAQNDVSRRTRISIDLKKHPNPNEYKKKIDEICKFIMKNQKDEQKYSPTICEIIGTNFDEEKSIYHIDCYICYSFSFQSYHQQHDCKWFELKSFVYDILMIKRELETTYSKYPAVLDINDYSIMIRKNYSIPFPQTVLLPVVFIKGYLQGLEKSDTNKFMIDSLNWLIDRRQEQQESIDKQCDEIENEYGKLNEENLEEKKALEYLYDLKKIVETNPSFEQLKENYCIKECIETRTIKPFEFDPEKFKLIEMISAGAHGCVFRCSINDKNYVMKQSIRKIKIDELKREYIVMNNCKHNHIVNVLGFYESSRNLSYPERENVQNTLSSFENVDEKDLIMMTSEEGKFGYLFMEECKEYTLRDYIHPKINMNHELIAFKSKHGENIIKSIFGQIIDACFYLYDIKRMVHRDLKPSNILIYDISEEMIHIKLGDFGFTRTIANSFTTQAGTPNYVDPRIEKNELYGEKADLYSLGCILYELYYKKSPQFKINGKLSIGKKRNENNTNLEPHEKLLIQLLEKNPTKRIGWDEFYHSEYVQSCMKIVGGLSYQN